jgi:GT2 family glycosyltransferase
MQKNKIGVGIITCNRKEYFYDCLKSIDLDKVDKIVVINDGKDLDNDVKSFLQLKNIEYILNEKNLGVGKTKNKALKFLLEEKCEHIFILEDDCIITNNDVWKKYIEAYNITKVHHFNYGPASPWNRKQEKFSLIGDLSKRHLAKQDTEPNPKLVVEYKEGFSLSLYEHIVAMFTYFHSSILNEVGLLDEGFYNAWEHVEHTYRIIKAGKYTPFWWFADISGSENYIKEAKNEKANTSLASNEEKFMKQVEEGLKHFYSIHKTIPSMIQAKSKQEVLNTLKNIYDNRT